MAGVIKRRGLIYALSRFVWTKNVAGGVWGRKTEKEKPWRIRQVPKQRVNRSLWRLGFEVISSRTERATRVIMFSLKT